MNRFLFNRWRREYSTQQIKVFPLVFRNSEMEEAFHNDTTQRDVEQLRFSSIVAMFAYGMFVLVDIFLFPPMEARRLVLLRMIGEVIFLGAVAFTFIHNQELKKRFSLGICCYGFAGWSDRLTDDPIGKDTGAESVLCRCDLYNHFWIRLDAFSFYANCNCWHIIIISLFCGQYVFFPF